MHSARTQRAVSPDGFWCVSFVQIRSDKEEEEKVEYSLGGHGADKPPFNLFLVNPVNGFVRITGILDREERAEYNVSPPCQTNVGNCFVKGHALSCKYSCGLPLSTYFCPPPPHPYPFHTVFWVSKG